MGLDQSSDYLSLPENLPVPIDDGAARHLVGMALPSLKLKSTSGEYVDLALLRARNVLFIYPMTGVPGIALPEGWDDIPGARGCTPQACAYRDHHGEILNYANAVFGISNQESGYQIEFRDRVHLPYHLLSDYEARARNALNLPSFDLLGRNYLKRLTLIVEDGVVKKVHYPVFPSNQDADWVLRELRSW